MRRYTPIWTTPPVPTTRSQTVVLDRPLIGGPTECPIPDTRFGRQGELCYVYDRAWAERELGTKLP